MLRRRAVPVLGFFSGFSASAATFNGLRFLCSSRTHPGTLRRLQNRLVSLLQRHPPSRRVAQQVHCCAVASGCFSSLHLFNTLLRCYSLAGSPREAFLLCKQFRSSDGFSATPFDSFTFTFLLNTCAALGSAVPGAQLHGLSMKSGFESHVYVQTALVYMYGSCGFLVEAHQVFVVMPEKNSVSWNVLITGFAKWGQPDFACSLLENMPAPTVVSWTAVIDGYAQMNRFNEAFGLFRRMVGDDAVGPSEITIFAIIPAVSNLGDVRICQSVHCYGEKRGFNASDIQVMNSLIDSYAKCGCALSAWKVFSGIPIEQRNLVSWTSIISALAMHGKGKEALENFERMKRCGLKPNRVTFLSILNACSHGGLVEEGLRFFEKMGADYGVKPDVKHYGSLIDLLGRSGRLEEAEKVASEVPPEIANDVIWRTLLGACGFHGDILKAERATEKILEIERGYGGDYVLMSNIFAGAGRFQDAEKLRKLIDQRCTSKVPGHSLL
ncbi:pentatricopeptide repeat-containing protein At1g09220, mitochondrial-like [Punica granatum]|uniref:Pentatricopeptide repeat-containing protein At1g09220, mitochondrial-like n=1 Tax=Punica granatum TaxID=22663 RepID=A0A6P8DAV8_PUNGR|nr:pentatricopeptide repeat-containing protein At1g09220, mitochondrial-like [Punica granatum]